MHEISLSLLCALPSDEKLFHGSCPFKVMTGVRIDMSAVATGCVEADTITAAFTRHTGKYV
jgi:hypothetical protein